MLPLSVLDLMPLKHMTTCIEATYACTISPTMVIKPIVLCNELLEIMVLSNMQVQIVKQIHYNSIFHSITNLNVDMHSNILENVI